jgi:nucleoside-diphosphate-sugar epimerase
VTSQVVVTGAAGIVGGIILPHLSKSTSVTAIDIVQPASVPAGVTFVRGTVGDPALLNDVFRDADVVIHLASGQARGWEGLLEVEIAGSVNVFAAAQAHSVRRVIVASSNHVVGGYELEAFGSYVTPVIDTSSPPRPDSPYAAAKLFIEGYGRYVAESSEVSVSCLRIGTVRSQRAEEVVDAPEFDHIPGGREGRLARLRRTWLQHGDLIAILCDEAKACERFRLRFAVSLNQGRFWSTEVFTWDG